MAVQCTDLVSARPPRIEQHTVMDNQLRILEVSVINRWLADFLVRSPCGSPVHGLRDRSMGDQRTQINNRTANCGRLPMPLMWKRFVCDRVDGNVNSALQNMNCPRTTWVVSKDGSEVGTHQIRSRCIVIDVSGGFGGVVSTPRTTGHCITCSGIARDCVPRANICNGGFANAPRSFKGLLWFFGACYSHDRCLSASHHTSWFITIALFRGCVVGPCGMIFHLGSRFRVRIIPWICCGASVRPAGRVWGVVKKKS